MGKKLSFSDINHQSQPSKWNRTTPHINLRNGFHNQDSNWLALFPNCSIIYYIMYSGTHCVHSNVWVVVFSVVAGPNQTISLFVRASKWIVGILRIDRNAFLRQKSTQNRTKWTSDRLVTSIFYSLCSSLIITHIDTPYRILIMDIVRWTWIYGKSLDEIWSSCVENANAIILWSILNLNRNDSEPNLSKLAADSITQIKLSTIFAWTWFAIHAINPAS